MHDVPGHSEACKILDKNLTQRAKRLLGLKKYVEGTQYDGLPDWFSEKVPLWERAPCIVYPIVKSAIDSNVDLLLGDHRFPNPSVDSLEGKEAESFEKAVRAAVKQARYEAACREVFANGQGVSSACAIFGVRSGRLFSETVEAWWCTPTLNVDGSVAALEIRYPYLTTVKQPDGTEKYVCKIYRRTIDTQKDTTYAPALGREDGTEPEWKVSQEITHGLGYCPVVWYAHMRGAAPVDDFDGKALHAHLTDEVRAHDFALSQRHRAALYAGDPQWTEIGVEPGFNPTNAGRKPEVPASLSGRPGERPHAAYVSESPTTKARKKSPGTVWQYGGDAQKIKVELHTLPGDALKVLTDHAKDLRNKICESMGVVFLDLESMPNESRMSGRGLEVLKARQLDRVDNYRNDFGDKFFKPGLGMLLRIALDCKLPIDDLEVVKKVSSEIPNWSWHNPPISLMWGSYFKASGEEEELIIRGTMEAFTTGFVTMREVAEKLRGIFNIKDIDAHMSELEKETSEREKKEMAQQKELATHAAALKPTPAPKGKNGS